MSNSVVNQFMLARFIDPDSATVLEAAAGGAMLAVILAGDMSWRRAEITFLAGMVSAYWLVIPTVRLLGGEMWLYGMGGLIAGYAALPILKAANKILASLSDDPIGTLAYILPFLRKKPNKDDKDG